MKATGDEPETLSVSVLREAGGSLNASIDFLHVLAPSRDINRRIPFTAFFFFRTSHTRYIFKVGNTQPLCPSLSTVMSHHGLQACNLDRYRGERFSPLRTNPWDSSPQIPTIDDCTYHYRYHFHSQSPNHSDGSHSDQDGRSSVKFGRRTVRVAALGPLPRPTSCAQSQKSKGNMDTIDGEEDEETRGHPPVAPHQHSSAVTSTGNYHSHTENRDNFPVSSKVNPYTLVHPELTTNPSSRTFARDFLPTRGTADASAYEIRTYRSGSSHSQLGNNGYSSRKDSSSRRFVKALVPFEVPSPTCHMRCTSRCRSRSKRRSGVGTTTCEHLALLPLGKRVGGRVRSSMVDTPSKGPTRFLFHPLWYAPYRPANMSLIGAGNSEVRLPCVSDKCASSRQGAMQ